MDDAEQYLDAREVVVELEKIGILKPGGKTNLQKVRRMFTDRQFPVFQFRGMLRIKRKVLHEHFESRQREAKRGQRKPLNMGIEGINFSVSDAKDAIALAKEFKKKGQRQS